MKKTDGENGLHDGGESGYSAFEAQRAEIGGGWTAMRYHCDSGPTVGEMLSFKAVFEINPFATGRKHASERRAYAGRKDAVLAALDIQRLMRRRFASLSNGEMRRVLLAKELLKCPARLAVRDPYGGLDQNWIAKMETLAREMAKTGTKLSLEGAARGGAKAGAGTWVKKRAAAALPSGCGRADANVVEIGPLDLSFGRRTLFKRFSWTVRKGERWILRGPNGSGKTTLLALITGDSPLAYAFDISIFGVKRACGGVPIANVRRHIGIVSAEREAVDGITVEAQLASALRPSTKLLLLDEPCCNISPERAKALLSRVSAWLNAHPSAAAICVAHSMDHVPDGFDRELSLVAQP